MPKFFAPALALTFVLWAAPLWAQSETLKVDGHVAHPLQLTLDQVKALPPVTVSLTFQSDHGPQTGTYTGALLLDIVKQAAPVDQGSDKGAPWRHVIIATGHDGYGVAVAIGEIDPRFAGKQVLVAYERDGKPMNDQTFRLVVPGDAHGGRSVNDLASLEIN
jgi:DMSO/TMAO reductase YedYZ molybdopterin-dependent catalytic subunit